MTSLLERVPGDKMEWKPHPKSFALGHLTQLVAKMPGWITNAIAEPMLDLAAQKGYSFERPDVLLAEFDGNVKAAHDALAAAKDDIFPTTWTLKMGERVLFAAPKGVIVRQHINHLVHHRGQLTVYLRLLDVPIPSIYGPTADERNF